MLAKLYQQAWIRERLKSLLPETIRQRISSVVFDYSRDSGVNPDTLQAMHRYYQADVSAVASLLGIDLSGWGLDSTNKTIAGAWVLKPGALPLTQVVADWALC